MVDTAMKVGKMLVRAQAETVRREARQEAKRISTGLLYLALGAVVLVFTVVAVHVGAFLYLRQTESALESIAMVGGADVLVTTWLLWNARRRLAQPAFERSRSVLSILLKGEDQA